MSDSKQKIKSPMELLKPIAEIQFVGLTRVILGLPVEHFFDRFKTYMQAEQPQANFRKLFFHIIKKYGLIHGIFAGFSSQVGIQIFKQYYRWPMMILIPKYYKSILPTSIVEKNKALHKIIAGGTIAIFEAIITCPLERIKCQQMTQQDKRSVIKQIWKLENSAFGFTKNLYTGIQIMMLKQMISWTNYLYWDHKARYLFKKSPTHALTIIQCIMCSFLTAIPNILFVQPFDTVKTLYQMEKNQNYRSLSVLSACLKLYNEKGIISFYAGWKIRMSQFVVQALFSTPVMDYLERKHGIAKHRN